jgi:hypothetical protein
VEKTKKNKGVDDELTVEGARRLVGTLGQKVLALSRRVGQAVGTGRSDGRRATRSGHRHGSLACEYGRRRALSGRARAEHRGPSSLGGGSCPHVACSCDG